MSAADLCMPSLDPFGHSPALWKSYDNRMDGARDNFTSSPIDLDRVGRTKSTSAPSVPQYTANFTVDPGLLEKPVSSALPTSRGVRKRAMSFNPGLDSNDSFKRQRISHHPMLSMPSQGRGTRPRSPYEPAYDAVLSATQATYTSDFTAPPIHEATSLTPGHHRRSYTGQNSLSVPGINPGRWSSSPGPMASVSPRNAYSHSPVMASQRSPQKAYTMPNPTTSGYPQTTSHSSTFPLFDPRQINYNYAPATYSNFDAQFLQQQQRHQQQIPQARHMPRGSSSYPPLLSLSENQSLNDEQMADAATADKSSDGTRARPRCWDHNCNGRVFSTFSNLLRHQREKGGTSSKSSCPRCGTEFTRTTARNSHIAHGKCKPRRGSSFTE